MNAYDSEQEQVEAIKKWWKENGVAVVIGIVLGVGGLVGWRSWTTYVENRGVSASMLYEQMSGRATAGDRDGALDVAEHLATEYDGTGYGDLSALAMARTHYARGETIAAVGDLQSVVDNARIDALRFIARARLARIHLDQGELDKAEAALAGEDPGAFAGVFDEIRGDILVARGDRGAARTAYARALAKATTEGGRSLLQIKLDDLGPQPEGDAAS